MCMFISRRQSFFDKQTHTMNENKYNGDVAYYATMMALIEAMRAATMLTAKPNPIILKSLEVLEEMSIASAPIALKMRCSDKTFRTMLQIYIDKCGLCPTSVLQLLKKYEQTCAQNNHSC